MDFLYDSNKAAKKENPYEIIVCLGQGSFGQVFLAEGDRDPKSTAPRQKAIKMIRIPSEETRAHCETKIQQEGYVLKKCLCENIIKYYHLYQTPHHYCLVFEYCENGDLAAYLKNQAKFLSLSKAERAKKAFEILKQLLKALIVLHKNKYMHRDIKPSNILICNDYQTFKLGDLGLAKGSNLGTSVVGTMGYYAPEIILKKRNPDNKSLSYDNKVDIWSLGAVFYEILAGKKLFNEEKDVFELDFTGLPEMGAKTLELMLEKDPKKRCSAGELLEKIGETQDFMFEDKETSIVKISKFYDSNWSERNPNFCAENQSRKEDSFLKPQNTWVENIAEKNANSQYDSQPYNSGDLFMNPIVEENSE